MRLSLIYAFFTYKKKKIVIFQLSDDVINVDLNIKENKFYKNADAHKLFLRYKINKQF